MAEAPDVVSNNAAYAFALEVSGFRWSAESVIRRVARVAAQTGVSASVADLRRYSMGRLPVLGVGLDVVIHRRGLSAGSGMLPLFTSAELLASVDREAVQLLGRDLDQAFAALASAG